MLICWTYSHLNVQVDYTFTETFVHLGEEIQGGGTAAPNSRCERGSQEQDAGRLPHHQRHLRVHPSTRAGCRHSAAQRIATELASGQLADAAALPYPDHNEYSCAGHPMDDAGTRGAGPFDEDAHNHAEGAEVHNVTKQGTRPGGRSPRHLVLGGVSFPSYRAAEPLEGQIYESQTKYRVGR